MYLEVGDPPMTDDYNEQNTPEQEREEIEEIAADDVEEHYAKLLAACQRTADELQVWVCDDAPRRAAWAAIRLKRLRKAIADLD